MSDDKSKRGSADHGRINLNQDYEVRDCTESLGVTKEERIGAVKAAGDSAKYVREYLKNRSGAKS